MAAASACLCIFLGFHTGSSDATRTRHVCSNLGDDTLLGTTLETDSYGAFVSPFRGYSSKNSSAPDHQKLLTRMASVVQESNGVFEPNIRVESLQAWFTMYFQERFTEMRSVSEFNRTEFEVVLVSGAAAWASGSRNKLSDLDCWVYGIRSWKTSAVVKHRAGEEFNQMQRPETMQGAIVAVPEIDGWDPISDKYEGVAQHFEGHRGTICERGAGKVAIQKMGWAEQLAFKLALITGGRGRQGEAYKMKGSDIDDLISAVLGIVSDANQDRPEQLELWKNYVSSQADNGNQVFTNKGFILRRKFVDIKSNNKVEELALSEMFNSIATVFNNFYQEWQDRLADHVD